jgi:hypothetical protein
MDPLNQCSLIQVRFSAGHRTQIGSDCHPVSHSLDTGVHFPALMWVEGEEEHVEPCSAESKNTWCFYLHSSVRFIEWCLDTGATVLYISYLKLELRFVSAEVRRNCNHKINIKSNSYSPDLKIPTQ